MEIVTSFSDSPFLWFFANMFAVIPNIFAAVSQPELWLDWLSWNNTKEDKQSLMRFIYYGASIELFFIVSSIITIYTILALLFRPLMWKTVTTLELIANTTGRFFAWLGWAFLWPVSVFLSSWAGRSFGLLGVFLASWAGRLFG